MKHTPLLECIATSLFDAQAIERAGADRVELVSALPMGGISPSAGLVQAVLKAVTIPVVVMLRPNFQNFCYREEDLREMRHDALLFQSLGVRHVVLGILDEQGIADTEKMEQILDGTDFTVTFHRAIDTSKDVARSLERINACERITHILTSLGQGHVLDNLDRLPWYKAQARPTLILGSGITRHNVTMLYRHALRYGADIHVGTGIRHKKAQDPVDPFEIALLKEAMEHKPHE